MEVALAGRDLAPATTAGALLLLLLGRLLAAPSEPPAEPLPPLPAAQLADAPDCGLLLPGLPEPGLLLPQPHTGCSCPAVICTAGLMPSADGCSGCSSGGPSPACRAAAAGTQAWLSSASPTPAFETSYRL